MANYFDTDGMWDYMSQFDKPATKKPTSLSLRMNGKIILDKVRSWEIRKYYKEKHVIDGSNGKRVWRVKLQELGYTITNNYD